MRLFAGFILIVSLACLPAGAYAFRNIFTEFNRPVAPTLLYPATNDISLEGKDSLVFRWETTDAAQTDHYELRLYDGYNTTVTGLILKLNVGTSPAKIPASTFKQGGVYTWSLRQVLLGGKKSGYSYSSFRIIKK